MNKKYSGKQAEWKDRRQNLLHGQVTVWHHLIFQRLSFFSYRIGVTITFLCSICGDQTIFESGRIWYKYKLPWRRYERDVKLGEKWNLKSSMCVLGSCVWLFATPWTVAFQVPLSMEFSRQEILEWVAIFFSGEFSWPRDQTQVSCIAGIFFAF